METDNAAHKPIHHCCLGLGESGPVEMEMRRKSGFKWTVVQDCIDEIAFNPAGVVLEQALYFT